MVTDILSDCEIRMGKAVEALKRDLATIRTGRASPNLLDRISVDYYGVPTPIHQMATVSVPEARLIVIQPWDRQALAIIEKSILKSDLGLTPTNDGNVIRLGIPQLTEERRKELAKIVKKKVEESRVAVRNIRRDAHDTLRKQEKEKLISEDEQKRTEDKLQKLTDQYIVEVDKVGQAKEAELMEV